MNIQHVFRINLKEFIYRLTCCILGLETMVINYHLNVKRHNFALQHPLKFHMDRFEVAKKHSAEFQLASLIFC